MLFVRFPYADVAVLLPDTSPPLRTDIVPSRRKPFPSPCGSSPSLKPDARDGGDDVRRVDLARRARSALVHFCGGGSSDAPRSSSSDARHAPQRNQNDDRGLRLRGRCRSHRSAIFFEDGGRISPAPPHPPSSILPFPPALRQTRRRPSPERAKTGARRSRHLPVRDRAQTIPPAQAAATQVATTAMAFSTGRRRATRERVRAYSLRLIVPSRRLGWIRSICRGPRASARRAQRTRAIIQRASGLVLVAESTPCALAPRTFT